MSLNKLKKKADKLLREKLLRDAERVDDRIKCYITGKYFEERDLHVCHYIRRENPLYRYDLVNCKLCCKFTNTVEDEIETEYESASGKRLSLHEYKFRNKLISEYGLKKVEEMETYSGGFKLNSVVIKNIIKELE